VRSKIKGTVAGLCRLLRRKEISADIAVYIINAVIIPAVIHRACTTSLTTDDCKAIEQCWMVMVKHKAHMTVSTPNALVWSTAGLGVTRLQDALDNTHIADLARRLDDDGVLGKTARCQAMMARRALMCHQSAYAQFFGSRRRDHIFGVYLAHRIWARGAQVVKGANTLVPWRTVEQVPLERVLPRRQQQTRRECYRWRLLTVGQVLCKSPARSS
jgi:hypothetical protein